MKIHTLALLLALFFPVFSKETPNLEIPIAGGNYPSLIEVGAITRMLQIEAGNQGEIGMRWCAHVLKNRAAISGKDLKTESESGFCLSETYTPETWEIALKTINEKPCHSFTYFLNPKTATDKTWLAYSKTRTGRTIGQHYFFN